MTHPHLLFPQTDGFKELPRITVPLQQRWGELSVENDASTRVDASCRREDLVRTTSVAELCLDEASL